MGPRRKLREDMLRMEREKQMHSEHTLEVESTRLFLYGLAIEK